MNNISLFFFFFIISFSFTFLRMGRYFERVYRFVTHFIKILQRLPRLRKFSVVIPLHPLERLFVFITTIYIIISLSLITEILGDQINGYMRISDWLFYLTIPGLIISSIITVSFVSLFLLLFFSFSSNSFFFSSF